MAFTRIDSDYCISYPLKEYQWLDLANLEAGEKGIIGIKTVLPEDICPNNYTDVNFVMVSPTGSIHPWKLGSNGIWSFKICWEGWKQFNRNNGRSVCVKLVKETGISKKDIGQRCWYNTAPNAAYVAGVHSVEESVWMQRETLNHVSVDGEPLNYWTSGVRDGTCEGTDSYDKKINFNWNDEMTTGVAALIEENSELSCKDKEVAKNCLVIRSQGPSTPQLFGDFDCESTASIGGGFCIYDLWRQI